MALEIPKSLTLASVLLSKLPPIEVLIKDGDSILEASMSWKKGKSFGNVNTFSHNTAEGRDSVYWHCRVSNHHQGEISFEQLWKKLGKNKVLNEQRFKPSIKEAIQIKSLSESASIWSIYHAYPPPLSPRVFTEYQVIHLNDSLPRRRTGIMISVPVDLASSQHMVELEEKGVRARHIKVERIQELDDDLVEWRMIACEDLGGLMPKSCTEKRMPAIMAKDVHSFTSWFHSLPAEAESELSEDIILPRGRTSSLEHI